MGKLIAVVSGKGGTGKTSFVANTAIALAVTGLEVLCLDCDITLRNLDLALGLSDKALMDFSDVLAGRCTLAEAAVPHFRYPLLQLLTAPVSAGQLPLETEKVQTLLDEIHASYDLCLIDAPAGLGKGFHLAATLADEIIVVTTADPSALRDAQRTAAELQRFPAGKVQMVVNRVQRRMLRSLRTNIDDIMDTAGLPLLGIIPEDKDVPLALNRGLPLRDCSDYASRAYANIARRLTGQKVPLMKI